jgi:hypothetical protein
VSYEVNLNVSELDDAFEQHMWERLVLGGWRWQRAQSSSSSTCGDSATSIRRLCRVARFVFLDPFVLVLLFPALQLLLHAQRAGHLPGFGGGGGSSGGDADAGGGDGDGGLYSSSGTTAAIVAVVVLALKLVSLALNPAYNGGVVDHVGAARMPTACWAWPRSPARRCAARPSQVCARTPTPPPWL